MQGATGSYYSYHLVIIASASGSNETTVVSGTETTTTVQKYDLSQLQCVVHDKDLFATNLIDERY